MSIQLTVGSKVVHDYSLHTGEVLEIRKDPKGYNYKVKFYLPEKQEHLIDWFKLSVLRIGKSKPSKNPYDFVEPCEENCTKERHAYHQGQWDMATRMAKGTEFEL